MPARTGRRNLFREKASWRLKDHFSLRIGKLRIIYTVVEKEKTVYILAIGPRETVYE